MGRQLGQRRFVLDGKDARLFIDQLERPEQLARSAAQRHTQQRAGFIVKLRVDTMVDRLRLGGGVDAARLAGLDHLAHHAAIVGDT